MPKIRNIIIFVAIAGALILAYIFIIKPSSSNPTTDLVSTSTSGGINPVTSLPDLVANTGTSGTSPVAGNFLTLLLNVKTIQLNTDIFSDPAFTSLHDSSIVLTPDAVTGRANPFAQFGTEDTTIPASSPTTISPTTPASITTVAPPATPLSIPVIPPTPKTPATTKSSTTKNTAPFP